MAPRFQGGCCSWVGFLLGGLKLGAWVKLALQPLCWGSQKAPHTSQYEAPVSSCQREIPTHSIQGLGHMPLQQLTPHLHLLPPKLPPHNPEGIFPTRILTSFKDIHKFLLCLIQWQMCNAVCDF